MGELQVNFSINYSPEAAQLFREKKIRVDRFKCPDWPDMIAEARQLAPVYVHFPLDAGSPTGRVADFELVERLRKETDTPFVNMHLVTRRKDFPQWPVDKRDGEVFAEVIAQMVKDVQQTGDRVGMANVIVENIPYFGPGGEYFRASVEPEMIRAVVEKTGCGFLLDISHARIAAHYMGVDAKTYIEQLPLDRLRELHVTGITPHNGKLADHMQLGEEDWKWFEWALEEIRARRWGTPWIVAFEYGGVGAPFKWRSEASVIEEQVPRLWELVKRCASADPMVAPR